MTQEQTKNKRRRPRRNRRPACARELPDIFFCGDPHGGFDQINEAARLYRPDAMVILGDLQPPAPLQDVLEEALAYTDIWWIPGNHDTDTDEFYDYLWRSELRDHNLHGRSVNIHGLRIAGLGGVFRGQVWMPDGHPNYFSPSSLMRRLGPSNAWRGGVPRRHRSTIFPSVYNSLLHQHADVLVTHEAPGCHKKGFCALDKLARTLGVKWIFHGHQHEDRVYCPMNNIVPRAVGYRGVVNLQGEVVIAAQLDPREVATLEAEYDWEAKKHHDGDIVLVRDEDGKVSLVPKCDCEGLMRAILPPCVQPKPLPSEAEAPKVAKASNGGEAVNEHRPSRYHSKKYRNTRSHGTRREQPASANQTVSQNKNDKSAA